MKVLIKNKNNASVRGAWQPTLLACSLVWHRQSSPASVLAVWILLDSARPTFGSTRRRDLHFAYVSLHTYIGNTTNIPFANIVYMRHHFSTFHLLKPKSRQLVRKPVDARCHLPLSTAAFGLCSAPFDFAVVLSYPFQRVDSKPNIPLSNDGDRLDVKNRK